MTLEKKTKKNKRNHKETEKFPASLVCDSPAGVFFFCSFFSVFFFDVKRRRTVSESGARKTKKKRKKKKRKSKKSPTLKRLAIGSGRVQHQPISDRLPHALQLGNTTVAKSRSDRVSFLLRRLSEYVRKIKKGKSVLLGVRAWVGACVHVTTFGNQRRAGN